MHNAAPTPELLMAIAVTAEACGRTFSEAAARQFAADLSTYPQDKVLVALHRCRMEVKTFLTPAHVFERISDDRPGADEAWAIGLRGLDESETIVTTPEILAAMSAARPVLDMGDEVGARMAFKDAYNRLVAEARAASKPIEWLPTLGWDLGKRATALREAVKAGLLPAPKAKAMLLPAPPKKSETDPEGLAKLKAAVANLIPASEKLRRAREEAAAAERAKLEEAKRETQAKVDAAKGDNEKGPHSPSF
ncbi:hypothetical protein [Cupriavidus necator]